MNIEEFNAGLQRCFFDGGRVFCVKPSGFDHTARKAYHARIIVSQIEHTNGK